MLSSSGAVGYIHEPFNPRRRPGWTGDRIPYWYLYVCEDNERFYGSVLDAVMAFRYPIRDNLRHVRRPRDVASLSLDLQRSVRYRATRPRPLLKDPLALFSAEWLERRYGAQVVVLIRHPVAFVSSIKRLNWQFRFRSWLAQDYLVRDWLHPYYDDMQRAWAREVDIIDQGILMWNVLHHVIDEYRRRHPSWRFVRHEDVSASPEPCFRALYETLDLAWSPRTAERITGHSRASNPSEPSRRRHGSIRRDSRAAIGTWRTRLTDDDVGRVARGTAEIAERFGYAPVPA